MPISLQGPNSDDDTATQLLVIASAQQQLEDQINGSAQYASAGDRIPFGRPSGSLAGRPVPNGIALSISAGGKQTREKILSDESTDILQVSFTDADPTTTDFPADGDWGWHLNTSTNNWFFARNYQGTIVYPNPGGAVNFTDLLGTLSDAQHGARSGGTLHADVTTSVSGFMTATDKVKLNNYPADCTDATGTGDSNAVQRVSGRVRANIFDATTSFKVAATQVVTTRRTGYTNFSNITFLRDISAIDFSGSPILADGANGSTTNFRLVCRFLAAIASDIGATHHGLTDCD